MERGNVVQMKSGGPLMTVQEESLGDPEKVFCKWFDKKGRLCHDNLYKQCLNLIKEDRSNVV